MIHFLTSDSRKISYSEILSNSTFFEGWDAFEQSILTFCKQWLSGQASFQIFTSGSTGAPKPILLTRQQMMSSAKATAKALNLVENDKALVCLQTAYIGGLMMLVRGMVLKMNLYIAPPASNPLKEIEPRTIDFFSFVPIQLENILLESSNWFDSLNQAKAILIGGASVSESLTKQVQILKAPVWNTYGMTETVSHIALKQLNGQNPKDEFVVLEGVEIKTDERNCLQIKSETTDEQWIITNDVVEMTSSFSFKWIGRADHIINSGGIKIQLEEIEKQVDTFFSQLDQKINCIAGGLPDKKLGEKLVLVLETHEDINLAKNLQQYLRDSLSKYYTPKEIFFVERLERTATDKIDRKQTLAAIQSKN